MGQVFSAVQDIIHFATSIGADVVGALNSIPKIVSPVPPTDLTDVGVVDPVTAIKGLLKTNCEAAFKAQFGYSYMADSTASGNIILGHNAASVGVELLNASTPDWSAFQNSLNTLVTSFKVLDPSEFSTTMFRYVQGMYSHVENYQSMSSSVYEEAASQIDYAIVFTCARGHLNKTALFVYFVFVESEALGLANGGTPALNSICSQRLYSPMDVAWQNACDGGIPANAVVGGNESNGVLLYVGRFSKGDELCVGKINPSLKSCCVSFAGSCHSSMTYQVLTNPHHYQLDWVPARVGQIPSGALQGGSSPKGPTFIGRAHHAGSLVPGKVVPEDYALFLVSGHDEHQYTDYEVLCVRHIVL